MADAKRAIARTDAVIARLTPVPEQNPVPATPPRSDNTAKRPGRPTRRPDR